MLLHLVKECGLKPQYWYSIILLVFLRPLRTRIRLRLRGMYHPAYYPVSIRAQYNELKKSPLVPVSMPKEWNFYNLKHIASGVDFEINCAGAKCDLSQLSALWRSLDKKDIDPEVVQSSHRFHYFVEKLAIGIDEADRSKMLEIIAQWLNEFDNTTSELVWQPYTVSERLCNWIVCWQILAPQKDQVELASQWLSAIQRHVVFLVANLEYPASGIVNNHILNNARALYIAGQFLDREVISELGRKVLKIHVPVMVGGGGFLREASSHYQWLLTRSILEIEKIAQITDDQSFIEWLDDLPEKMVAASQQLLPSYLKKLDDMPRIGDVSPDAPFDWFSPCSEKLKANWNTLWNRSTPICTTLSDRDGWLTHIKNQWYMVAFSHPDKNEYPVGHGHNDFGSYCLYYNGFPIVIDVGRLDYQAGNVDREKGTSAEMHNTIILNGQSALPAGHGWASIISGSARRKADCYSDNHHNSICWSLLHHARINWTRELTITSPSSVSVTDEINNIGLVEGYLYFSPEAVVEQQSAKHLLLKISDIVVNIFIEGSSTLRLEPSTFFPRYGEQCQTTRLYWHSDSEHQLSTIKLTFDVIDPSDDELKDA